MSTLVCFHAHPDDESIGTGGSIARAVDEGHNVVIVMATDGRHGETPADLAQKESLVDRRRAETEASANVLGAMEVRWLGYHDSGMTGWPQNQHPEAFMRADIDQAAGRLADILGEVGADVLTCYDWHGGYGHPDHIQVHRVGHRAAQILTDSGRSIRLLESTMNRSRLAEMIRASGESEFDPNAPADDGNPFGTLEEDITMAVDVSRYVEAKRASIACHASQVTDSSMFLQMPPEMFTIAFGTEWFIEPGQPGGAAPGWFM
ncbi:MAG: PIG-L family deacetylase [Actinomycetota bacterium]